jgi:hypothetical protein
LKFFEEPSGLGKRAGPGLPQQRIYSSANAIWLFFRRYLVNGFSSIMSKRVLLNKSGDGMETGGDVEEQQEVRKGRGKEKKWTSMSVGSTGRVSSGRP